MANNGLTEEEVFMSRSELLDELNLQHGMLSSLDPDTEDYDLSKSALEQEIARLKTRLKALKQKKQQQNAKVTLRGPFLAAASSSSKPARNPASSRTTVTSSNSVSLGNQSATKYKFSDPFADPFSTNNTSSSMEPFFNSHRNHALPQPYIPSPVRATALPDRTFGNSMKRSIDESNGGDMKAEPGNKSRRTSPGSSISKPAYKEDQNGFIDLCSDEEDALGFQKKALEAIEQIKRDSEAARRLQNDLENGSSSFTSSKTPSRPNAFNRIMGPSSSQSAATVDPFETPAPSNGTTPSSTMPGSFTVVDINSDDDLEFMSSNPCPPNAGRTPSIHASYPSARGRTWQDSSFSTFQRPSYSSVGGVKSEGTYPGTSFEPNSASKYTTQAGTRFQSTQGPYNANKLAQANGIGGAAHSSLFSDLGMPGSSLAYPFDLGMPGTQDYSQTMRDDIYNYVTDPRKTAEDIRSLLANITPDTDIPKESRVGTPEGLRYPLYEHQKVALQWLTANEMGTNKGGILADDMGLGKTLSTLALILSRPAANRACKTTLIVGPVALLRQWQQEISTKILPNHSLSVFIQHQGKTKTYQDLRQYDVVLTSYGTLASEYKRLEAFQERKKHHNIDIEADVFQKKLPFIGSRSKWYRVVLDEAQNVKNKDTKSAKAVCCLQAENRWCLTGTPMMNGVHELYSLIRFLRIRPYNDYQAFQGAFAALKKGTGSERALKNCLKKLQAVLKAILLRRTKNSTIDGEPIIKLPPKTEEQVHAIFNEDEQEFYTELETKSKVTFNRYLKAGTVGKNYSNVLILLLRLRQAACHPHLIMDFDEAVVAGGSPDQVSLAKGLAPDVVRRIKDDATELWECPVCYDPLVNPLFTLDCCHHVCSECLVKITSNVNIDEDQANAKCPSCRGVISMSKVIDFSCFKQTHMGEKPVEVEVDSDLDTNSSDDSEYDSLDDDPRSRNDADAWGNLKDFIVHDDKVDDGFVSRTVADKIRLQTRISGSNTENDDDDDDDDDDLDRPAKVQAKSEVQSEVKPKFQEDSEDDYLPDLPQPKAKAETKDGDYLPDTPKEALARGMLKPKLQRAALKIGKEADEKASRRRARKERAKARGESGKDKECSKNKSTKRHLNMATLKKESQKNAAGKKKYMRYLRKNWESSAKVDKLMELLRNTPDDVKTIVFSQFTTLLDLCEVPISEAEIGLERYDGSMKADLRHEAVQQFQTNPKCRVLLVSLKAGNAGLNLVAGSQVVIMDPFWNPFVENQAVDRAYRIGQLKPVSVHRILIKGTVEDRIIALQERKRKLVDAALDEKSGNKISRLGVEELTYLFNSDGDTRETMARVPQNYMPQNYGAEAGLGSAGSLDGNGRLGSAITAGFNAGVGAFGSGSGYSSALTRGLGAAATAYGTPPMLNPSYVNGYTGPRGFGYSEGAGESGNPYSAGRKLMNYSASDRDSSPALDLGPDLSPSFITYGGSRPY